MKSATYLCAILILGVLAISPISGYESLYGRTFNLFNLLSNPQTQFKSLLSRYSVLDASFNFLTSQYASLQSQITSLTSQISALTTLVNSPKPKCPASFGATGKVIGNFCYTLGITPKTFANAQLDCSSQGGKLAEPSPTTQANGLALYNSIKNAFGSTFTTSVTPSQNLWIGLQKVNPATAFSFASSGTALAAADQAAIFDPTNTATALTAAPANAAAAEGATLEPTGKYLNELQQPTTRNYICQSNAY